MDNRIEILEEIIKDARDDASDFDGKPFTGKTVGTYFGYHGASIAALADIIKSIIVAYPEFKEKESTIDKP